MSRAGWREPDGEGERGALLEAHRLIHRPAEVARLQDADAIAGVAAGGHGGGRDEPAQPGAACVREGPDVVETRDTTGGDERARGERRPFTPREERLDRLPHRAALEPSKVWADAPRLH